MNISFAGINVISQYTLSDVQVSNIVVVLSAHIPIHSICLGSFYVRSEVIHIVPPDYCVGKSVLHGKILREVRGHT